MPHLVPGRHTLAITSHMFLSPTALPVSYPTRERLPALKSGRVGHRHRKIALQSLSSPAIPPQLVYHMQGGTPRIYPPHSSPGMGT